MLRWIRRIVLGGAALLILLLAAGVVYEQWSRRSAAETFPPVGDLVEFDGSLSHLHCVGDGSPTVILEAGLDGRGSQAWVTVQPEIGSTTRVCSYDRAGILWSERREGPRDANRIVEELHALLAAASESPPYVMVGHSLGGPLIRVFSERFQGEVAGFVFVDAAHPEELDRFPVEMERVRTTPLTRRFLVATGFLRFWWRSSTPENAVQAHSFRTLAGSSAERGAFEEILAQSAQTGTLGDRPVVVLTAGRSPRPANRSEVVHREFRDTWFVLQGELADLSSNADHRKIEDATHYIQTDDPAAVITAVRDVVTAVREGTAVRKEDG